MFSFIKFIVNGLWLYYANGKLFKFTLAMLHTSKNIKNPGLRTLPSGVERYYVKGGGLSVIEVLPDDKIEIINEEGRQILTIFLAQSIDENFLNL